MKLKLKLDDLLVDTFQTMPVEKPKGTVFGEQCTCYTNCTCPAAPPATPAATAPATRVQRHLRLVRCHVRWHLRLELWLHLRGDRATVHLPTAPSPRELCRPYCELA